MRWPPTLLSRTRTAGVPDCESKNELASCRCSPDAITRLLSSTGIGLPSGPISLR